MSVIPRLRMFAGPNGSGKSTIKSLVPEAYLGIYINPDDLEKEVTDKTATCVTPIVTNSLISWAMQSITCSLSCHLISRNNGFLDLARFGIVSTKEEILSFFQCSTLLQKVGMTDLVSQLSFQQPNLDFSKIVMNSYFAAVAADFLRRKLIEIKASFTFETVMSSRDKLEFLTMAKEQG